MNTIDPIFITTAYLVMLKEDKEKGSATGFFFSDSQNLYLVTNKHVIYGEKYFVESTQSQIDKIKLYLHTNKNNLSENEYVEINLFKDGKKVWLEHDNINVDVVLVPLEIDRGKYLLVNLDKNIIDSSNIVVKFEKIFVIGYPYGWFDRKNNLPVTRIGHLSSPFKIPFNGEPIMLGDVETHKGMSGGPVFMELKDYVTMDENGGRATHLGASKIILVGIHSGQPRWDLRDTETGEVKETVSHSLINIWFSDLILEILNTKNISK